MRLPEPPPHVQQGAAKNTQDRSEVKPEVKVEVDMDTDTFLDLDADTDQDAADGHGHGHDGHGQNKAVEEFHCHTQGFPLAKSASCLVVAYSGTRRGWSPSRCTSAIGTQFL